MSYHGCSGNKGSTLSHIAKRFNASTKGDLCGFDTKRIEPACFYGCKSWHLADLLSTVHFLRRFVSVQNTQFRWLSGRYRTFWVKKTETKYGKKKKKCISKCTTRVQRKLDICFVASEKTPFFKTFSNSISCHAMLRNRV
jgi:hypothetical protein